MSKPGNSTQSISATAVSVILCVQCGGYALAKLNDKPLCWKCLYQSVCEAGDDSTIDIVPLETGSSQNFIVGDC